MEYTHGFALETTTGLHVGFALGSPSFKGESGDCVFMLMPMSAEGIETPLGLLVSELKVSGEHQWEKQNGNIKVLGPSRFALTISSSGQVLDMDRNEIGNAISLPEKK